MRGKVEIAAPKRGMTAAVDTLGTRKRQCFVIMPFSGISGVATKTEWTWIFDQLIRPAVEGAGLDYVCNRSEPVRGNIIADIIRNLADADLVIADLSGQNANVFYELGVRHALIGKSILLAQAENHIPSDLRNYAYHIYDFRTEPGKLKLRTTLQDLMKDLDGNPRRADNPVEDFAIHIPEVEVARKVRRCDTTIQTQAVEAECHRHFQTLRQIDDGKIPLHVDAGGYFRYFLDIVNSNTEPEDVTVFARLVNLEVRQKIREVGFERLFPAVKAAVDTGKLRIEYLLFLKNKKSLSEPDTKELVDAYTHFSQRVALVYEDEDIPSEDSNETFALLKGHRWVLTHGWDYSGRISGPVHWIKTKDYQRYFERYRRIQFHWHTYFEVK